MFSKIGVAKTVLDKCMVGHDDTQHLMGEKTRTVEISYEFIDDSFTKWLTSTFCDSSAIGSPFQNVARIAGEVLLKRTPSKRTRESKRRKMHKSPLSILVSSHILLRSHLRSVMLKKNLAHPAHDFRTFDVF